MPTTTEIVRKHITDQDRLKKFESLHIEGLHPIHYAAKLGHTELVNDLIESCDVAIDLQTQTLERATPWSIALKQKQYFVCDTLIAHGFTFERALESSNRTNHFYFNRLLKWSYPKHNLRMRTLYRIGGWEVVPDEKEKKMQLVSFPKKYSSTHAFKQGNWSNQPPLFLSAEHMGFLYKKLHSREWEDLISDIILNSGCCRNPKTTKDFYDELQDFYSANFDDRIGEYWNSLEQQLESDDTDGIKPIIFVAIFRLLKYTQSRHILVREIKKYIRENQQQVLEWIAITGEVVEFEFCLDLFMKNKNQEEAITAAVKLCENLLGKQVLEPALADKLLSRVGDDQAVADFLRGKDNQYLLVKRAIPYDDLFFHLLKKFNLHEQINILKKFIVDIVQSSMSNRNIFLCLDRLKNHKHEIQEAILNIFSNKESVFQLTADLIAKLISFFPKLLANCEKWVEIVGFELVNKWIFDKNFKEAKKIVKLLLMIIPNDEQRAKFFDNLISGLTFQHRQDQAISQFVAKLKADRDILLKVAGAQRAYLKSANRGEDVLHVPQRMRDFQSIAQISKWGLFAGLTKDLQNYILSFVVKEDYPRERPTHVELISAMRRQVPGGQGELVLWKNLSNPVEEEKSRMPQKRK